MMRISVSSALFGAMIVVMMMTIVNFMRPTSGDRGGPEMGSETMTRSDGGATRCKCAFVKYTSSPLEQKWVDNVGHWQRDACAHTPNEDVAVWLDSVAKVLNGTMPRAKWTLDAAAPLDIWDNALSVFTYEQTCDQAGKPLYVHVPVEPTASIARDPRKCWEPATEKYTQSKVYLLPLTLDGASCASMQWKDVTQAKRGQHLRLSQAFLYDAGATSPLSSVNPGTEWTGTGDIVRWYLRGHIRFDRVWAWEPRQANLPTKLEKFNQETLRSMTWFNHGVEADADSYWNPLNTIRATCRKDDLCVFKLDIDSSFEEEIVRQLFDDEHLLELIDEFYYEHHVFNPVMAAHGLGGHGDERSNLQSWYKKAIPLRRKGFRIHFWP